LLRCRGSRRSIWQRNTLVAGAGNILLAEDNTGKEEEQGKDANSMGAYSGDRTPILATEAPV
jgi:hypothetical protein